MHKFMNRSILLAACMFSLSTTAVKASEFSAPAQVTDTRASISGAKVITIVSSYTGTMAISPAGLVPATRSTSTIGQGGVQCFDLAISAGAQLARLQLFNADTSAAANLDLAVFDGPAGTGSNVGVSAGSTSDEVVTLASPVAGTYSACITAIATSGTVTYTLSSWVVAPAAIQTLRASGPRMVYAGSAASVGLFWSVPAGARYLGNLTYFDTRVAGSPVVLGSTVVFINSR